MRSNPADLAIFKSTIHSVTEEMGAALRRTSFSPNIKERRDYSCAVFDAAGNVIAMGDHMPVHLGSMPMSVRAAIDRLDLGAGDMAILNDPYAGGTHLPDITMVLPVFSDGDALPIFYVAARAHHADVGGSYPGSMGPCREIYQEGIRIPPVKIMHGGKINRDVLDLLLCNVRTPVEREGDLMSQIGACKVGEGRLQEILGKYGVGEIHQLTTELLDYSEQLMKAELGRMPAGRFAATDFLDDDGYTDSPIEIKVAIELDPTQQKARVDFRSQRGRVYSEEQIKRLILLRQAVEQGHAIGQVAGIKDRGLRALLENSTSLSAAEPARVADSQILITPILRAIERYDYAAADRDINRLAAAMASPRDFVHQAALPLMRTIGALWHEGKCSIAQEHMLSNLLSALLASLMRTYSPSNPPVRVLLATPRNQHHSFSQPRRCHADRCWWLGGDLFGNGFASSRHCSRDAEKLGGCGLAERRLTTQPRDAGRFSPYRK